MTVDGMKATGVEWASSIPSHWTIAKICMVARLESGHTPSRQHPEYWRSGECTIPWFSLADVWQLRDGTQDYLGETSERISPLGLANSSAQLLPAGTVALSRTASVGYVGIMPQPMATTQDFANFVCGDRLMPEYLLYALRAMRDEFRRMTMGSTHQTIYVPDLRKLTIPVPPLADQSRIVGLLRVRIPSVDALIAKKERLIELLQAKRQALIAQAVTKGLNPTAKMKESGVDWVGTVPAHWDVAPLYSRFTVQLGKMVDSSRDTGADHRPYLRNFNIQWEGIDLDDVKTMQLSAADRVRYRLRPGDLLVCEGGANANVVGKSAIWRGEIAECYYQKALHRLRPCRDGELPEFLLYALRCAFDLGVFVAGANANTVFHLTAEKLRAHRFAFPPSDEQRAIVEALHRSLGRMDRVVVRMATSIERLREYRQALITAAVTGADANAARQETSEDESALSL